MLPSTGRATHLWPWGVIAPKPFGFDGPEPDAELNLGADLRLVQQASDQEGMFFAGERTLRATTFRDRAQSHQRDMDDVWARHAELVRQLRASETRAAEEKVSLYAELEEAREQVALAEREKARLTKETLSLEIQLLGQWQEAELLWTSKKEEFIKSKDFEALCSDKVLEYFEQGFQGCLTQLRVNGYSEVEHPVPFLNWEKELEELPEDGEIFGQEEEGLGDAEEP